jgi:cytochrome c2
MKTVGLWLACLSVAAIVAAKGRGDEAKGKVVFQQCMMCHRGESTDKKIGPGLKGLFQKEKLLNGKRPTEQAVRARIDEGGGGMPPFKDMLSDQEKDDLVAYMKTL